MNTTTIGVAIPIAAYNHPPNVVSDIPSFHICNSVNEFFQIKQWTMETIPKPNVANVNNKNVIPDKKLTNLDLNTIILINERTTPKLPKAKTAIVK